MDSELVMSLFAGILAAAGPLLLVTFWRSFKEDSHAHPIYKAAEKAYAAHPREIEAATPSPGKSAPRSKLPAIRRRA